MLFSVSSHLSPKKKSTSITIELQIQDKTEKSQFKFSFKKMLNNIKTETKMSRLLFYYTSIKITYF